MNDDAQTAYLFQCKCDDLFAVSHDSTGRNIPRNTCAEGWSLLQEFQLGIHDDVPAPIMPEPIIRGILAVGYYIWRDSNPGQVAVLKSARKVREVVGQ